MGLWCPSTLQAHFNFMNIQFEYEKMKHGYNPCAIYKMTFDTGHFYYGSSKQVKSRFLSWKTIIKNNKVSSKIINDVLPLVKKIRFDIIEITTESDRLERETHYLKLNSDNELNLNRRVSADPNSKEYKPLPAHLVKKNKKYIKKYKGTPPPSARKPVFEFRTNGEYVGKHLSISHAASFKGVCGETISTYLLPENRNKSILGSVFRKTKEF